jgi:hypothetical protein
MIGRKPAELVLVNGADRIAVRPRPATAGNPVMCKQWELSAADVRVTSVPVAGGDGVTESDAYMGARTVTLDLVILGGTDPITQLDHDAYWYADTLARMAHPAARPTLRITRAMPTGYGTGSYGAGQYGGAPQTWSIALRGNPFSIAYGRRAAAMLEMQLTFSWPSGYLEADPTTYTATLGTTTGRRDLTFPFTMPYAFGATGGSYPSAAITVGGDAEVRPIVYITGPVTNPEIGAGTDRFRFTDLTLAAGQTAEIDMGAATIRISDPSRGSAPDEMSAYAAVDWTVSDFWTWPPGAYTFRYYANTGTARVRFAERRLNI